MEESLGALIQWGSFVALMGLGYGVGKFREASHYKSIRKREAQFASIPVTTTKSLATDRPVLDTQLVYGSVVVSVDYYKRFLAGLRNIFGGEVTSFSSLISSLVDCSISSARVSGQPPPFL